jgi:S1-C subfamily serine protease
MPKPLCGTIAVACLASLVACATKAQTQPGDPFVRAFRSLKPSVVLFSMKIPAEGKNRADRFDEAYGSGVIVASDASGSDVLTVEHVVHGGRTLRATLDERRSMPARVFATDNANDLALVRIDAPDRAVARLGSSRMVEAGMQVGIAGYPIPDAFADERLGVKTSVYAGRISSMRRDSFELDLPVIPGESGGPVFDAQTGAVVALAESRFDDEKAIGFGIPIDVARAFLRRTHVAIRTTAP